MSGRLSGLSKERGQAAVVTVLFLAALLGVAATVLDVGAWFHAQRATQAAADASALAGAQALPHDPGTASALASDYSTRNDGGIDSVAVSTELVTNDTIRVEFSRPAPGFFTKILGIDSVTVGARASARASTLAEAKYVAPFGVDDDHPLLTGGAGGGPQFGVPTELDLEKVGPGAFRMINIDGSRGGVGPGTLADWILNGLDQSMPLGWYYSDPGAKFNSSQVKDALTQRIGTELLFPVYSVVEGNGANARYNVIGWVGFTVTSYDFHGSSGTIDGSFTRVIWAGLPATNGGQPSFGARTISLVE